MHVKLLDFNTACRLGDGALTMTGTPEYAAPEVLLGQSPSELSDVWSSGLCLHLMLAGCLPHRFERYGNLVSFAEAVSSTVVVLHGKACWMEASHDCKSMIKHCLEIDKFERLAAMTLLEQEPWLSCSMAGRPACRSRSADGLYVSRVVRMAAAPAAGTRSSCLKSYARSRLRE